MGRITNRQDRNQPNIIQLPLRIQYADTTNRVPGANHLNLPHVAAASTVPGAKLSTAKVLTSSTGCSPPTPSWLSLRIRNMALRTAQDALLDFVLFCQYSKNGKNSARVPPEAAVSPECPVRGYIERI